VKKEGSTPPKPNKTTAERKGLEETQRGSGNASHKTKKRARRSTWVGPKRGHFGKRGRVKEIGTLKGGGVKLSHPCGAVKFPKEPPPWVGAG